MRLPSLQIVGRELVEAAARRRTYALRCVAALGALAVYGAAAASADHAAMMIGHGDDLVMPLVLGLLFGVSAVLPTMAVLSIAREREQGTLALLALTAVGPTSLVLQKFLTQLLMAGTLLAVAAPFLAEAYGLGGMEAKRTVAIAAILALHALHVTALGVAVGSWVRAALAALALANAIVLVEIAVAFAIAIPSAPWWAGALPLELNWGWDARPAGTLPSLAVIGGLLSCARLGILRNVEPPASSALVRTQRFLDAAFERLDARWFDRRHVRDLPDAEPIRWREASGTAVGNWRHLTRILLPVLAVVLIAEVIACCSGRQEWAWLAFSLASTCAVLLNLASHAAILRRERSGQTLDVLLTTRLTAKRILDQKLRALARLRWSLLGCCLIALATIGVLTNWLAPGHASEMHYTWLPRTVGPLGLVEIAAELAMAFGIGTWLAVLCGLALRSFTRAVIVAVLIFSVWLWVLPLCCACDHPGSFGFMGPRWLVADTFMTATFFMDNGRGTWEDGIGAMLMLWLLDGMAWGGLKHLCHARAGRWIGSRRSRHDP